METYRSFEELSQIERIMGYLYLRFKPLVEAKWFKVLTSLIIFVNPVALFPQVRSVFTASSVAGIALETFFIFAVIKISFVFYGIKLKSASIFFSMLISFIESTTIIIAVLIRG